ncbi:PRD domain-containing protein [Dielma fastidiosa]|nr:PRD domain-containing protein [Dielma fastidiosa]
MSGNSIQKRKGRESESRQAASSKYMRIKNRDLILEFLGKCYENESRGATTSDISKTLQMQRTNVSKLLNELCAEGLVEKDSTNYPVIYRRTKMGKSREAQIFETLIGYDGSLKRAVHLAKSAVLYPKKSLNMLLLAKHGTGKDLFIRKIFEFAVASDVCAEDAPFVKMNCLYYKDNAEEMNAKFNEGLIASENGFFFIDNCHFLDAESKTHLSTILDNSYVKNPDIDHAPIIVCSMPPMMSSDAFFDNITSKISIIISLPELNERGLYERFKFIEKFFCNEAHESGCQIKVNSEVLIALLLYPCDNIKQLFHDIRQACASAYSRELEVEKEAINVLIVDFSHNVRSGLLNYKNKRMDVDNIIREESDYVFNSDKLSILDIRPKENESIYDWINAKKLELHKRGFSSSEINTIVNVGIETEFNKYRKNLFNNTINKEQLSQLVDSKIIELVDDLLAKASSLLNRYYAASIHYGLCLHIQALVGKRVATHPIKIEKMMEFIEHNKEEYSLAMSLCDRITAAYDIELPIDEIVIIAMFLCTHNVGDDQSRHPSLLVAMHGVGVAKALAETVKILNDMTIYSYDLSLNKKPLDAYEDIKQTVLNIPYENGILIVYDMGSLKDIFNMVAIETGIRIKLIELPVTLMLMDFCRKLMLSENVNDAYDVLVNRFKSLDASAEYETMKKSKVIVSFCMTGEGGAVQIKRYIEQQFKLEGIEIIPVQLAEQSLFLQELNTISKEKEILCIVGTFNPNVYGIPFIPIEDIFNSDNHDLSQLLYQDNLNKQDFLSNSETIFEHLAKELKNVDALEAKDKLIQFIFDVEKDMGIVVEMNEKIGLLVHLACTLDRLKAGNITPNNLNKEEVIRKNMYLYRIIVKHMIELEKAFSVNVSDDEICNIIYILKKSRS